MSTRIKITLVDTNDDVLIEEHTRTNSTIHEDGLSGDYSTAQVDFKVTPELTRDEHEFSITGDEWRTLEDMNAWEDMLDAVDENPHNPEEAIRSLFEA